MNYGRLALAVVAAFVADAVYGFLVYGTLLKHQFSHFPTVYRPDAAQMTFMPILFGGNSAGVGRRRLHVRQRVRGGSGIAEGTRFGMLLGVFAAGYAAIVGYALTNIDHFLGFHLILANFFEWTINGAVIGLIYKPSTSIR